jgi:DNA-binding response OmpR family regulator
MTQKILIVEDDLEFAKVTRMLLEENGYTILEAHDGTQAWELLHENPDITLLDWKLPGLSGIDLLKRLKSENITFPGYIIMVTGRIATHDIVEALLLGADDYIVKPFAQDELLARVYAGLRHVGLKYDRINVQEENKLLHQKLQSIAEIKSLTMNAINLSSKLVVAGKSKMNAEGMDTVVSMKKVLNRIRDICAKLE